MATIVIIDDSKTHRDQLEVALVECGYVVLQAQDGVEGLEVIRSNPEIHLILCDVNMPRMGGLLMMEQVRNLGLAKDVPALMITTEADPEMKARGKAVGVRAWVTKPFDLPKLLGAIERLLGDRTK